MPGVVVGYMFRSMLSVEPYSSDNMGLRVGTGQMPIKHWVLN